MRASNPAAEGRAGLPKKTGLEQNQEGLGPFGTSARRAGTRRRLVWRGECVREAAQQKTPERGGWRRL